MPQAVERAWGHAWHMVRVHRGQQRLLLFIPGKGSQPRLGGTLALIPSPVWLGLWVVDSCPKDVGPRQVGCGEVHRRLVAPQGLSGCLFWLCVWGPPAQHMRLLGQKLHFLGNPQASASELCTENHRDLLPGGGQKKIPLGFLPLREQLFLFGLGWFQGVGVSPCTPGKEPVSVKGRPKCSPPLCGRAVFAFLGIIDS